MVPADLLPVEGLAVVAYRDSLWNESPDIAAAAEGGVDDQQGMWVIAGDIEAKQRH